MWWGEPWECIHIYEVYQDGGLCLYYRVNFVCFIGPLPGLSYKYTVTVLLGYSNIRG